MLHCWQASPEQRPSFGTLVHWLETLMQSSNDYLDLDPGNIVNNPGYNGKNATYLRPISKGYLKYGRSLETVRSEKFTSTSVFSPGSSECLNSNSSLSSIPSVSDDAVFPPSNPAPAPPTSRLMGVRPKKEAPTSGRKIEYCSTDNISLIERNLWQKPLLSQWINTGGPITWTQKR